MSVPRTERLGVAALDLFFSQQGWLFREQSTHDYGIDAHVEIVENERPTGKLIALQIKSGVSFFKENHAGGFVFRMDDRHAAYWVGHSMPVVVVLYNPETKTAHWQHVARDNLEKAGNAWKIVVPKFDLLADTKQTLSGLEKLAQPEPYVRRLNRLRTDRCWIELIASGSEVRLAFDDWANKSLPRYQITIYSDDDREVWPTLYAPNTGVEAMLRHFFPWANFSVDEGEYEQSAQPEWYKHPKGIVPVRDNGETESYILILSLNDFGKSFVLIDDYLSDPTAAESIGFTLE